MLKLNINVLPDEIIREISTYIKFINYRNGKYIYRISENDERYKMLKQLSPPINVNGIHDNFESFFHKIRIDRFDINIYYHFNYLTKNTKIHIGKYKTGIFRGAYIKQIYTEEYLMDKNCVCVKLSD
jgi:hypothetical protein